MVARQYSNKATPATLGGGISSSDTSLSLSTVSGLPASFPYSLVIEPDSINAEVVSCTALAGTIATVTRGQDGTTAVAHDAGSSVYHDHTARDFQEPQDHIVATAVHGATGAVVGTTNTQTLTNKTLDLASNTLTGTKAQFNTALSGEDFATLTGTETLTNKTLTAPTVSGTAAMASATLSGTLGVTGAATLSGGAAVTGAVTATTHVQSPETTAGSGRTAAPYAKIKTGADQIVATSTTTVLTGMTTLVEESDATFGDTANSKLVVPVAGIYDFFLQVELNTSGTYTTRVSILVNGTIVGRLGATTGGAGTSSATQCSALGVRCAASDVVTADFWQNSGGNVTVTSAASVAGTYLVGKWVMP